MNIKRIRAQSTLEYVIILTVIIAAFAAASTYLKGKVQNGVNTASDSIESSLSGNPSINGGGSGGGSGGGGAVTPTGNAITTLCPSCSGPIVTGYTFDYGSGHKVEDVQAKFNEIYAYMSSYYPDPSNALYWTLSWLDDNNWIVLHDNR